MLCSAHSTSIGVSAESGACPVLRPLCFQHPPGLKQKDRARRDKRGMLAPSDAGHAPATDMTACCSVS